VLEADRKEANYFVRYTLEDGGRHRRLDPRSLVEFIRAGAAVRRQKETRR